MLTVLPAGSLTITTPSPLPAGVQGTSYSQTLAATGGTSPYTWSLTEGSLPMDLHLSSAGGITGTPSSSETSHFTVQVRDSATPTANTATKDFVLTIGPPFGFLQQPEDAHVLRTGDPFSFRVVASGAVSTQWQRRRMRESSFTDLPGATQATYNSTATRDLDEASFQVIIRDAQNNPSTSQVVHLLFPGDRHTDEDTVNFQYDQNGVRALLTFTLRGAFPAGSLFKVGHELDLLPNPQDGLQPTGLQVNVNTWDLQPSVPIPLTITNPVGIDSSRSLVFARYDPVTQRWINVQGRYPHFLLDHFSSYALFQASPANNLDSVKVYPNPFRPSQGHTQITFTGMPANTTLKIYTVSGEKIKDLTADSTGTVTWDGNTESGQRAASAVYFALLESNGQKKTVKVGVQR
jgi:hypothetical protein